MKKLALVLSAFAFVVALPIGVATGGGGCVDDGFEPNDSPAQATPLTDGVAVNGQVCGDNTDTFSLALTEGRIVTATLNFEHDDGDLDMRARDPNEDVVTRSLGFTDVESIRFVAPATGTFFFQVFTLSTDDGNGYQLTVTTSDVVCTITGTPDNDKKLKGTSGDDVICGLGGNDKIDGKLGNDIILGGDGNDKLKGGKGEDQVLGQAGNDKVGGNNDDDLLAGNDGVDKVNGGGGDDYCLDAENPEDKQKNCATPA